MWAGVLEGPANLDQSVRDGLSGEVVFGLLLKDWRSRPCKDLASQMVHDPLVWSSEVKRNRYQLCICMKILGRGSWTAWGEVNGAHAVSSSRQGIQGCEGWKTPLSFGCPITPITTLMFLPAGENKATESPHMDTPCRFMSARFVRCPDLLKSEPVGGSLTLSCPPPVLGA